MAMPVFDAEGKRRGIYVINYLATTLIGNLQNAGAGVAVTACAC